MTSISERLKAVRENLGKDQATFGVSLGVSSRDTISRWERGLAFPAADVLAILNEKYGINMQWLITGKGDMTEKYRPHDAVEELVPKSRCLDTNEYLLVPLLQSWVKGGPEGRLIYEGIADYYPFKRYFIERLVGGRPERQGDLYLARVRGDSMAPTINDNEVILFDTYEGERLNIRTGDIYLV
ncbi:MAG: XRE family transcriptional regulator, partial [Syntrophobacteraceae bacterium]